MNEWAIDEPQRSIGINLDMLASGGNQNQSRSGVITVDGFSYLQLTLAVEAFGERVRERGRHMLNNDDAGPNARWKLGDESG